MHERITFSGHATVVIDVGGRRLLTDPILRRHIGILRNRQGVATADLGDVDMILVSHLHHDHLDFASLRALGRETLIVCPAGAERLFVRRGFTNLVPLQLGESTAIGAATVRAVRAAHGNDRALSRTSADPLGYVIEGERSVYFAGDTDLFEGMGEIGDDLDVALIPIWGWGPKLGDGHLNPETAAEAARRIAPRAVVPIHWGTLTPIGARRLWPWMFERPRERFLAAMAERAPEVEVRVLRPGESLDLEAAVA